MATDYGEVGRAFVKLFADRRGLQSDLDKAESDVKKTLDKVSGRFDDAGKAWSAALTAPIVAAAAVAVASLNQLDKANQRIAAGTGLIGARLREVKQDFIAVLATADDPVNNVAEAVTQLYQRTGQTGQALRTLAGTILDIAQVTGRDGVPMINTLTRVFGDWSIATAKQSAALDILYTAEQKTGTALERIGDLIVRYGGPLRQIGYGFEEAAAMMAKWEAEGVNTELVAGAIRESLGRLARAGIQDVPAAFQTMIANIKEAGTAGEANALSLQYFGAVAGPDMAAAVREGRFEIEALTKTLKSMPSSISAVASETQTMGQFFGQLKNQLIAAFAPLSDNWAQLDDVIAPVAASIVAALGAVVKMFASLPFGVQATIIAVLALVAAVGPLLIALGGLVASLPLLSAAMGIGAAAFAEFALPVIAAIAVIGALRGAWMLFGRDITRIMKGLASGVADGFRTIMAEAKNFSAGFLRGFASLWEAVGRIFEVGVNAAASAITWLYDRYNDVVNAVAEWIGGTKIPDDLKDGQAGFFNEMRAGIQAVKDDAAGLDFVSGQLDKTREEQTGLNEAALEGAKASELAKISLDGLTGAAKSNADAMDKAKQAAEKLRREREQAAAAEQAAMDAETRRMRQEMDADVGRAEGIRGQAMPGFSLVAQIKEAMELAQRFPAIITPEVRALFTGQLLQQFYTSWADAAERIKATGDPVALTFSNVAGEVDKVITTLGELDPVIKKAQEDTKKSAEKSKMPETWGKVAEAVGKVGGALASLPGTAGKIGQVMVSVANISKAALAALSGGWMAIIDLIVQAIQVLGIFGGKNEEEAKGMAKIMDDLGDAVEDWGKKLTDVLVDFVKTGKISFKDLADSIISDILRITIQAAIVEPLIKFGKGALGFAKGGAFSDGKVYRAAAGAIVTRRTGFVGPMGLGIAGEGGGKGEAILPLAEVGGVLGVNAEGIGLGDGGNVYVEVHNHTPAQVKTESITDPTGMRRVILTVYNIVNQGIGEGAFDNSAGGAWGVARQGIGG